MMGNTIRALNVLSAVILLTVGVYVQVTFQSLLSPMVERVIVATIWLYFFGQVDLFLAGDRNKGRRRCC